MPVPRITPVELSQALAALDDAAPLVVDARLKYPFEHSTVQLPGAVRLSGPAHGLPRGRRVVLYDSDPDELAASAVAAALRREGYEASVLAGGIAAWLTAGLPVETKAAPKPAAPAGSVKA